MNCYKILKQKNVSFIVRQKPKTKHADEPLKKISPIAEYRWDTSHKADIQKTIRKTNHAEQITVSKNKSKL